MTFSISFSNRVGFILILGLSCLLECKSFAGTAALAVPEQRGVRIAVLPFENLSAKKAPLPLMRQSIIEKLRTHGYTVLDDADLEKFMVRNRVRYTGGIDTETARQFRDEYGIDAVLITNLEHYATGDFPKISIISRLVSTGDKTVILWMESVGLSGDQAPGLLSMGLIGDPDELREKAVRFLVNSLTGYLSGRKEKAGAGDAKKRFKPKIYFRAPSFTMDKKYVVLVIPFLNRSSRKYGGEILWLHFVEQLKKNGNFDVIEPGVVRQALLRLRLIYPTGISLVQEDLISHSLGAELVVSGKVQYYEDTPPRVEFGTLLFNGNKKVFWASSSYNKGDDGVFFFDVGKVFTANALTSEMIKTLLNVLTQAR